MQGKTNIKSLTNSPQDLLRIKEAKARKSQESTQIKLVKLFILFFCKVSHGNICKSMYLNVHNAYNLNFPSQIESDKPLYQRFKNLYHHVEVLIK